MMFLTITANSALDRVLFIEQFIPGGVMRSQRVMDSVGGKGFDTSVALSHLGVPTVALGFVAGETGKLLVRLLESYGIQHDLVWAKGETRIAHVIVEEAYNRHSHVITPGYGLTEGDARKFMDRFHRWAPNAKWVIAAGSLPDGLQPDFYHMVVDEAAKVHVPVLIDCPGKPALDSISARPAILKMNEREFAETFGLSTETMADLRTSMERVRQERELANLVVSWGAQGVGAATSEGVFWASSPQQKAVNAAGAGDAVSGALAWRLSQGEGWPDALRWAAAAGAAVVLTEGTADLRMDDVLHLLPQVEIKRL
jgi:1-phosphofructokinase family hexose kinase